jgi:fatty acid-binding protein DegV
VVLDRPHRWQRALDQLLELVIGQVGHRPLHAAVTHNSRPAEAAYLAGGLERKMDLREIYLGHVTPLLGIPAGPMVAVSFWAEETGGRR